MSDTEEADGATRYSVNSVASAIAVFNALVDDGTLSLPSAATAAGVSRSTAYRLIVTLADLGLVERATGGGYQPGPLAYQWATRLLSQLDVRTVANPMLRRLRDETGESANLALLRDSELIYVDVLDSPGMLRTVEEPGTSVPIHAAAIGKAVAAFLQPDHLNRLLGPEPYRRLGAATLTTWPRLLADLGRVRERGFAIDDQEVAEGVACVAAPIMLNDRVIGAISLSGPKTRMDGDRLEELGKKARAAAEEITRALGPGSK